MATVENFEPLANEAVAAPESPAARPSLISSLRVRDFRLLWAGEGISVLGDQFYMIALPWLTLQLTGSGVALGATAALGGIPRAVFMLVGGAFTDRFSPRTVMLVSDTLRIFLTAFLTIAVLTHTVQLWMLFVSAFLFGLVDAFFFPANSAILPQLVAPEQLESGNALTQITGQLAGFVGPALAGLLIASLSGAASMEALSASGKAASTEGVGAALGFDTITFLVAAVALWLMKGGRTVAQSNTEGVRGVLASIAEGIRIVWDNVLIRTLILVTGAINFLFTGPMGVGLPVLANTRYAEGAAAMGYIFSGFGLGALVGALSAGMFPTPRRIGIAAMILVAVAGGFMTIFGLTTNLLIAVTVALAMGICIGYVNVMASASIQKLVAPEAMGRVMSLVMLSSFGLGPISLMLAGFLVDVSLNGLFIGAGILLVVISLASMTNHEMRNFVKEKPKKASNT